MKYKIKDYTFDNGLTLFNMNVPSDDISIIANVNAGSLYENNSNAGISHLIEHMIFKGTKKRPSIGIIHNELNTLGGENFSYTSIEHSPIWIRVRLNYFDQSLDLISDILFNSNMENHEINKEKEIIIDEIRNRKDDTFTHICDKFEESLFEDCEFSRPPIGFENTIRNLKPSEVKESYHKIFNPSNITLFIVGSKSFDKVKDNIAKYFSNKISGKKYSVPLINVPKNKSRNLYIKRDIDNIHLISGISLPGLDSDDSYPLNILDHILNSSFSDKILNKEPISYSRGVTYSAYNIVGYIAAYANFDKKNYNRVKEVIKEEFSGLNEKEISDSYVEDIINSKINKIILNGSNTINKAGYLLSSWLAGNIYEINSSIEKFKSITKEDIIHVAKKYLSSDNLTCVNIGKFN